MPHELTVRASPQLSIAVSGPQFAPSRLQKAPSFSATQAHTLVAPHVSGVTHVPHEATVRVTPQLSVAVTAPQFFPFRVQNAAFVSAAQPHTLGTPEPPQL